MEGANKPLLRIYSVVGPSGQPRFDISPPPSLLPVLTFTSFTTLPAFPPPAR